MKKTLLAICAVLVGMVCYGQEKVYCELVGTHKIIANKVVVSVDFGQQSNLLSDKRLVDESGQVMQFNSMVDALNHMSKLGWEFVQAYVVTIGTGASSQNVYHWLLSKELSEGEDIGLKTKAIAREEQQKE